MSFDRRDIRASMDVYTLDNVYLGSVLHIDAGSERPGRSEPAAAGLQPGSDFNGERLGPMPTQQLGNPGPVTQAAASAYGSAGDNAAALAGGTMVVGKWWGLRERRSLPLALVQTVSFERIVLTCLKTELT